MTATARFEGQSDFAIFLRTGLRFRHQEGADVEVKFNPWHDSDNGRFTFAGQGEYHGRGNSTAGSRAGGASGRGRGGGGGGGWGGEKAPASTKRAKLKTWTGGGGGDFRGAGASGSGWETPDEKRVREALDAKRKSERNLTGAVPKIVGTRRIAQPSQDRLHSSTKNGYRYDYDRSARVRVVDADLAMKIGWRSRKNQAKAGGAERRPSDHGGHYIAVRFNGSHSKLNHFAQDANFNMGAYRALEDKWAAALQHGKKVHIRIVPLYQGASRRPYRLHVDWYINGRHRSQEFHNERGGKSDGR